MNKTIDYELGEECFDFVLFHTEDYNQMKRYILLREGANIDDWIAGYESKLNSIAWAHKKKIKVIIIIKRIGSDQLFRFETQSIE